MDEMLKELAKLIYEPEHAEAPFCWCKPTYIAHGKMKIEVIHHRQRDTILDFVRENFHS